MWVFFPAPGSLTPCSTTHHCVSHLWHLAGRVLGVIRVFSRTVITHTRRVTECHCLDARLKHNVAGHTIDPDSLLHDGVLFALIIILHDRKLSSSDTFTSLIVQRFVTLLGACRTWNWFQRPLQGLTHSASWSCLRFLEESITFQFFCIICVMLLVLCTVGAQRWAFFKKGRGQAAPPNRREEAKQHHPKGPPRRQFSKKQNHKKNTSRK